MKNIKDLIPKNKGDLKTAEKLKKYTYKELKEIIPNLLEWIQDLNWPVAKPVADYLISINNEITNELLSILKSNEDQIWRYWIVSIFGPITESIRIKNEIIRIAKSPTQEEINEEVYEVARKIVAVREWKI